jgi:hypothetical protein
MSILPPASDYPLIDKMMFQINSTTLDYLSGQKLSNGHFFSYSEDSKLFSKKKGSKVATREQIILDLCRGKKVLHLGCADHPKLIKQKLENERYLHKLLDSVCEQLVGLDVNSEALEAMRGFGFVNVMTPAEFDHSAEFDLLLIPDVIEHLANVGDFLSHLRMYKAKHVVITTPNCYRLRNRLQFNGELVNTDHRYWFSPYTLAKSLFEGGLVIEGLAFTDSISWCHPLRSLLKIRFPLIRDGLLAVCTWKTQ